MSLFRHQVLLDALKAKNAKLQFVTLMKNMGKCGRNFNQLSSGCTIFRKILIMRNECDEFLSEYRQRWRQSRLMRVEIGFFLRCARERRKNQHPRCNKYQVHWQPAQAVRIAREISREIFYFNFQRFSLRKKFNTENQIFVLRKVRKFSAELGRFNSHFSFTQWKSCYLPLHLKAENLRILLSPLWLVRTLGNTSKDFMHKSKCYSFLINGIECLFVPTVSSLSCVYIFRITNACCRIKILSPSNDFESLVIPAL